MNKLDELIGRIRLILPKAELHTDLNHGAAWTNHWLMVRVGHALLSLIWHPGKSFRISAEADEGYEGSEQITFGEDEIHDVISWIVAHIIERGLA